MTTWLSKNFDNDRKTWFFATMLFLKLFMGPHHEFVQTFKVKIHFHKFWSRAIYTVHIQSKFKITDLPKKNCRTSDDWRHISLILLISLFGKSRKYTVLNPLFCNFCGQHVRTTAKSERRQMKQCWKKNHTVYKDEV